MRCCPFVADDLSRVLCFRRSQPLLESSANARVVRIGFVQLGPFDRHNAKPVAAHRSEEVHVGLFQTLPKTQRLTL